MDALAAALQDAGGTAAPRERGAQLRRLLLAALDAGARELQQARSGRTVPVPVAFAAAPEGLLALAPVPAALRADPDAAPERSWLLAAAAIGALFELAAAPPPRDAQDLVLRAGRAGEHLALLVPAERPGVPAHKHRHGAYPQGPPAGDDEAELAVLAFEEQVAPVARLRARAHALPSHVLDGVAHDLRPPIAAPLRSAEAVARLGGRPADPAGADDYEDAVLALLEGPDRGGPARPHDDPDPGMRAARRILQRLHGMGKWGGYHTEFSHLARGFAGNDRALAEAVGEALLAEGLLAEKPSVGQRHVFLNPRRAADIHALLERGHAPPGLRLP